MSDVSQPSGEQEETPITQWLYAARDGDEAALDALYASVYPRLHQMARSRVGVRSGATLSPTMVVNELFLKLNNSSAMDSKDRQHFYATCARAMRFIVADFARSAMSRKRGGDQPHCAYTTALAAQPDKAQELIDIDNALNDLEQTDARLRELVELKFFAGLSYQEIGELHERSERSIKRDWVKARAFLVARSGQQAAAAPPAPG